MTAERAHEAPAPVSVADGGARLPFRPPSFSTVVCNSVLTHVPDLGAVLGAIREVLVDGGVLVATVPTPRFGEFLAPSQLARHAGLRQVADRIASTYDAAWQQRHRRRAPPRPGTRRRRRPPTGRPARASSRPDGVRRFSDEATELCAGRPEPDAPR